MRNVRFMALAAALLVSACSHYSDDLSSLDKDMKAPNTQVAYAASPQDIAPAAGTTGDEFRRALAREYYDMAKFENEKAYDYKSSKQFTGKAMKAAKGELVVPSKVSSYDIPAEQVAALSEARTQLIVALKTQNTPDNAATLARAQARYECWLERAEEAAEDSHFAACKEEFEQSMAMLIMPAAGEGTTSYDILFGTESAIVEPASVTKINLIAQFLNDPKNATYTASLTGFDGAGGYGGGITATRVSAVRDALVSKGVANERLKPLISPVMGSDGQARVIVTLDPPPAGTATPYGSTTTTYVPVAPGAGTTQVPPQVMDVVPTHLPNGLPIRSEEIPPPAPTQRPQ